MKSLWQAFWSDESGQGLVEYALIIALVAVGLIAILLVLRNSIGDVFNNASEALQERAGQPLSVIRGGSRREGPVTAHPACAGALPRPVGSWPNVGNA